MILFGPINGPLYCYLNSHKIKAFPHGQALVSKPLVVVGEI